MDQKIFVCLCPYRSLENISTVRKSVVENPGISIRQRCQKLNILRSTMQQGLIGERNQA